MSLDVVRLEVDLVSYLEKRISIDWDRCFLTVSLAMPVAVMLSQCTGVGGWGCPISCRIRRCIFPSLQLRNNAPSSASAADATTSYSIPHNM